MNKILTDKIKSIVDTSIEAYIIKVSTKYSIPIEELEYLVTEHLDNIKDDEEDVIVSSDEEEEEKVNNMCMHILSTGGRKGKCCAAKIKPGQTLCTTHKAAKEKKSAAAIVKKAKIMFNPEINKHSCATSGIVFEENSGKFEAIGVYRNGIIEKLEEKDIKTCKIFNYLVKK